jgi:hypothetical protein
MFEALHHPGSRVRYSRLAAFSARLSLSGRTESMAPAFDYLQRAKAGSKGDHADITMISSRHLLGIPIHQNGLTLCRTAFQPPADTIRYFSLQDLTIAQAAAARYCQSSWNRSSQPH